MLVAKRGSHPRGQERVPSSWLATCDAGTSSRRTSGEKKVRNLSLMTLSKPVETVFETTGLSKGEEVLSLSAKGQDGQIEINSSIVTIHRKGMLAKMNK